MLKDIRPFIICNKKLIMAVDQPTSKKIRNHKRKDLSRVISVPTS